MKRASKRKITKWCKILLIAVLICTFYILGYITGLSNLPIN